MKLFLVSLILSLGSFAMVKKASIDGALAVQYDENYQETQRSLASQKEKPSKEKPSKEKPSKEKPSKEKPSKEKTKEAEADGDRLPSSNGQSFEELNENGVRYWKY